MLSQNQASTPYSVVYLWLVFLRTRRPLLALWYTFGLFFLEPGVHFWLCGIPLACISQNQVSSPGSVVYLWLVFLRTRRPLLALWYTFGLYFSEPGVHSWLCGIPLACISQNQASTPVSVVYLWLVFLRTRRPLLALWYTFGLYFSEPGVHSWLCGIPLACISQNQVSSPVFMLSLCLDPGHMNITSSISF